jgi:hypothetical protein
MVTRITAAGIDAIAHLTMKRTIEPKGMSTSVTTTRSGADEVGGCSLMLQRILRPQLIAVTHNASRGGSHSQDLGAGLGKALPARVMEIDARPLEQLRAKRCSRELESRFAS